MSVNELMTRARNLGIKDISLSEMDGSEVFSYTLNRRGNIIKCVSSPEALDKLLHRFELEREIRRLEAEIRKYYLKWPETRQKVEELDDEINDLKAQLKKYIGGL